MYKVENGNVIADEEKKHSNSRINVFKKEWVKFLIILVASICIAIIGIINNINRERQKVFTNMKAKVKTEVENELYSELYDKFEQSVRVDLKKEYRDFVDI